MSRAFAALLVGTSLLQPVAAWAETPSEAGAKRVIEAVRTYGPNILTKPGLVRVSPDGDGYRLVFDTAKAIADAVAPMVVKDATSLSLVLKELPDATWSFRSEGPFSLKAEHVQADRTASLSLEAQSQTLSGEFDPALIFPRRAELELVDTTLGLREARGAVKVGIKNSRLSSEVKDLADGRGDVDGRFSLQGVTLTQGAFPQPEAKIFAERIEGEYRAARLNLAGIAAMTRFWKVTAAGKTVESLTAAERAEVKGLLAKHLPAMDELGGTLVATGLSTSTGGKGLKAARLDYLSRWEAIDGQAALVMGARIADVGIDTGVWPKELEPILPKEAALNVRAAGFDLAALWKDAAVLRSEKEAALLPRDHFTNVVLPGGKIVMELTDSFARSSFYDIAVTGRFDLAVGRGGAPMGAFTFTARDFDRTIKYLQDNAKTVPVFGRAAFVALMMKGLGKSGADGALTWDVRLEDTGKITVNGQPLPM